MGGDSICQQPHLLLNMDLVLSLFHCTRTGSILQAHNATSTKATGLESHDDNK